MENNPVIGIDQLEGALHQIAQAVSTEVGIGFFESLVERLAGALGVDFAFVGQLAGEPPTQIETVCVCARGTIVDNFTYDLKGTPCANVVGQNMCVYESDVQADFPEDQLLVDMGIESYAGMPLVDPDDNVLGLLVVLDSKPIRFGQLADLLFKVFGTRAAGELGRRQAYNLLERIVQKRTAELTEANAQLRQEMKDRARAQSAAREHQVQLAHVGRLNTMGEMTTQLAHELNQPLTAIINYAEFQLRDLGSDSEASVDSAHRIIEQAERISGIIKRIRGFIERGEILTKPIDINQITRDAIELAIFEARINNVKIVPKLQPSLPAVKADDIQIEQVLFNLLRNVIEAILESDSAKGQIVVSTMQLDNGQVQIIVEDSGPGMSAEIQSRAFEPFFTSKNNGLGLGLSISRSILDAHHGTLDLDLSPLGGARFTLRFPNSSDSQN
jgi:signal transduction histidine kinase